MAAERTLISHEQSIATVTINRVHGEGSERIMIDIFLKGEDREALTRVELKLDDFSRVVTGRVVDAVAEVNRWSVTK
ncbi:MAG: hypothetical protein KGL39_16475 [Patescibacteria group bacterium]|nr:hypothetical protein [Patescibacteria group bacterium]